MTTSLPGRRPGDGLQPERTALAWSRTSFSVLGNGALLLLRDLHSYTGQARFVPAGLAVIVALLTYAVGMRRQRLLGARPLPNQITPRPEVWLVATAMLTLIVVSALLLPL